MQWRKRRLAAASEKAGGDANLGRLLGYKSGQQIGHMRHGRRPVTEDTIEKIESLHGYRGWFDQDQAQGSAPAPTPLPIRPKLRTSELVLQLRDAMRAAEPSQRKAAMGSLETLVQHIDDDRKTKHLAELIELTLTPLSDAESDGEHANVG